MKQNSRPIVTEIAQAARLSCLDELDGAVEAFGTGIADAMQTVVEQPGFMTPEQAHHFLDMCDDFAPHNLYGCKDVQRMHTSSILKVS